MGQNREEIQSPLHSTSVMAQELSAEPVRRAPDTSSHPGTRGRAERGGITPLPPASGRETELKLGHCFSLFQIRKSFVTAGRGGCRGWGGCGLLSGKCQPVHTTWRTNVCFITRPTEPAEHLRQACAPAPPPRRQKVTVMDSPILINVNKQKRNIK